MDELMRRFCLTEPDWPQIFWGLSHSGLLLRQVCVATTLAFVLIHIPSLQRAVLRVDGHWPSRLLLILLFGLVAVIDDRFTGIVIDVNLRDLVENRPFGGDLSDAKYASYAIIDLRDMVATVAGLLGGIPVGFGVGLIAGLNRYSIGTDVGLVAGVATLALGVLAGALRQFFPRCAASPGIAFAAGLAATLIQRMIILFMPHIDPAQSQQYACNLTYLIFFPKLLTNTLGCSLFILTMRIGRLQEMEKELRRAELNALRAQVEPHFLGNTLTTVQGLIEIDRGKAVTALAKLGELFKRVRKHARDLSMSVAEERQCLDLYIEIEKLRKDFDFVYTIEQDLMDCHIPAGCLQTLAENALKHGYYGEPFRLSVNMFAVQQWLHIVVADNGCGILAERLDMIQMAVKHDQSLVSTDGSGSALRHLNQSLQVAFPGKSSLRIDSKERHGTTVTLTHPLRRTPWTIN